MKGGVGSGSRIEGQHGGRCESGEMSMTCMGIDLEESDAGVNAIVQLLGLRTES